MASPRSRSDLTEAGLEIDHCSVKQADIGSHCQEYGALIGPSKSGVQDKGRYDSGLGSLGASSIGSTSMSLQSVTETFPEKTPVQCTEDVLEQTESSLNAALQKLTLDQAEDEGVFSCSFSGELEGASQSIEEAEVDVFEQDEDGDTLLHLAIIGQTVEVAKVLIDMAPCSSCLDIRNDLFQSPLHLAVLTEQVDIVGQLVAAGCCVACRDRQGNTPLHIACRTGNEEIVKLIVNSVAQNRTARQQLMNVRNCEGLTSLHVASMGKFYKIMASLFHSGADVNMGDSRSGRTVLHHAAERQDLETVSILLTHPTIDPDCQTFKGETPLLLAYWRNYQDIVKKLKSKGASFDYASLEDLDDDDEFSDDSMS